jgi:hypothetical protein
LKELLLFGPFVGSLSYEYSKFAPYAIFLKKTNPNFELAVFTRPERFDLYGTHANYLIPLKLNNDNEKDQIFFKSKNLHIDDYELMIRKIYLMYSKRFDKIAHIYPNIKDFYYQVKHQFPRNRTSFDFQSRIQNQVIVNNLLKNKIPVVIVPPKNSPKFFIELNSLIGNNELSSKYSFIIDQNRSENFYFNVNSLTPILNESSTLGYLIEIIKKSQLVVSKKNDITNLAILMGIPTVIIGEKSRIFNPSNTEVTFCSEDNVINLLSTKLSLTKKRNNNFDCI